MRLAGRVFGRRRGVASIASADRPFAPTETVPVVVTVQEPLDDVSAARVELGYVNRYRYRWAGRRDAAANFDDSSLLSADQVGTDYGSERDTEDWVSALAVDVPATGGVLGAGPHHVDVRIPSWAPGSSSDTVRWQVRLHLERGGRDGRDAVASHDLRVVVPAPDVAPEQVLEQGSSAVMNSVHWEITTAGPCCRAGDELTGVLRLTPREPITRACEVAVQLIRERLSHPLERTPGSTTESMVRPHTVVRKDLMLVQGQTTELPFVVPVPVDTDPSGEAVHASLRWWVQGRVMFRGLGGVERARLGIVVHTG